MFKFKMDSIINDYVINSKHTVGCASKELQTPEECNCWRVDFTKLILSKQKTKKQIYVSSKVKFASIWKKFRSEGYPIVSSWLDEADKTNTDMMELWDKNIEESGSCGVLVYFAEDGSLSNGGLIEVGSALSNNVPVIWAGPNRPSVWNHKLVKNIFYKSRAIFAQNIELSIRTALDEAMNLLGIMGPCGVVKAETIDEKTLTEKYLEYIKTKFNPKLNFAFLLKEWKEVQTLESVNIYLQYFSKIYSGSKYKIDSAGKEYFVLPDSDLLSRNWWDILKSLKTEPTFKNMSGFMGLYVWESFVGWCFEDETARKAFNIELKKEKEEKKEEVEFTITIPDNQTVAHIPSVKLSKASGTQNNSKERKLNRIKTHSELVKCTNKSRRIESVLSTSVTCGHCLKIGKKKGLWV